MPNMQLRLLPVLLAAVVILGAILLVIALLFSSSVGTLLRLFPTSILGVILFWGLDSGRVVRGVGPRVAVRARMEG